MTQEDKAVAAFKAARRTFPYRDFVRVMKTLGFEEVKRQGRTRGSARAFRHSGLGTLFTLDEPHDGEMTFGLVKRARQYLQELGLL